MQAIIVVILVALLGAGAYVLTGGDSNTETNQPADQTVTESTPETEAAMEEKMEEKMTDEESAEGGAMMEKEDEEVMMEKKEEGTETEQNEEAAGEENQASESSEEQTQASGPGNYADYSAEAVANANGKVALFFHANWCPSCRTLDADIKSSLSDIPSDVTILKVDYDEAQDLKTKHGVRSQHTIVVVDQAGNTVSSFSGGNTLEAVLAKI